MTDSTRMAVLIDADNTSHKYASDLLEEIAKYGTASVKRAYGDWTNPRLGGWKDELNKHAIQPMQQFSYTTGKNSTDSALIIDAMDLLYAGNLDGFVIVSSDSDFTRLATRLREAGRVVYGVGRRTTPVPFVAACDRFISLELLGEEGAPKAVEEPGEEKPPPPPKLRKILTSAIDGTSQDDGWATLSAVGNHLVKSDPSFDPRLYGCSKLSNLVKAQDYVEVKQAQGSAGPNTLWVRLKPEGSRVGKTARTRSAS